MPKAIQIAPESGAASPGDGMSMAVSGLGVAAKGHEQPHLDDSGQTRLAELVTTVRTLATQKDDLRTRLLDAHHQLLERDSQLQTLQARAVDADRLEAHLQLTATQAQDLEGHLRFWVKKAEDFEAALETQGSEIAQLREHLQVRTAQAEEFEEHLRFWAKKAQDFEAALETQRSQIAQLREQLQVRTAQVQSLEAELQTTSERAETLGTELWHRDARLHVLEARVVEQRDMLERIHNGWPGRFYRFTRAVLTLGRRR